MMRKRSNNSNGDLEDGVAYTDGDSSDGIISSSDDLDEQTGLMMSSSPTKQQRSNNGVGGIMNRRTNSRSTSSCCCTLMKWISLLGIMVLIGMIGFWLGSQQQQQPVSISQKGNNNNNNNGNTNPTSWFMPGTKSSSSSSSIVISNMDTKTFSDLMKEANLIDDKKKHTVKYDPSTYLSNNNNPFDWTTAAAATGGGGSFPLTPPRINNDNDNGNVGDTSIQPSGYLRQPHLVNNQLVFTSEGDAFVTYLSSGEEQQRYEDDACHEINNDDW